LYLACFVSAERLMILTQSKGAAMKKLCLVVGVCLGLATQSGAQVSGTQGNTTTTVVTSPAVPAVVTVLTQAQIDSLIGQCTTTVGCSAAVNELLAVAARSGASATQFNELAVSITGALVRAVVANPSLRSSVTFAIVSIVADRSPSEFVLLSPRLRTSLDNVARLVQLGRAAQVDMTAVASAIQTVPTRPVPLPTGGQNGSPS
jgi:hypothetical protein